MNSFSDKLKTLQPQQQQNLTSDAAASAIVRVCQRQGFTLGQVSQVTKLVNDLYFKQVEVANLMDELKIRLKLRNVAKIKALAVELAGERLLVDDKYFGGAVSKFIASQGVRVEEFKDQVAAFTNAVKREVEEARIEEEYEKYEISEVEVAAPQPVEYELKDPALEMKTMAKVLKNELLDMLNNPVYEMKMGINIVLVNLLLEDRKYQKEILNAVSQNQQLLSKEKIVHNGEKQEPTVANWLADFVGYVGHAEGGTLSTVKKAKYYNESPNVKNLAAEERDLLDMLFDFYENVINFYSLSERLPLEEIQMLPFTEEEQEDFLKKYGEVASAEAVESGGAKSIDEIYSGSPAEQEVIDKVATKIVADTRREYNKVVDTFYDYVLMRKRVEILACLNILAEIGGLDNMVATDKRFMELLEGYFKRNNLIDEIAKYQANPQDPVYVKLFLKYLLMERLGMLENDAARIGSQISEVFREHGVEDLSQMAYFDLEQKKFHWL